MTQKNKSHLLSQSFDPKCLLSNYYVKSTLLGAKNRKWRTRETDTQKEDNPNAKRSGHFSRENDFDQKD